MCTSAVRKLSNLRGSLRFRAIPFIHSLIHKAWINISLSDFFFILIGCVDNGILSWGS